MKARMYCLILLAGKRQLQWDAWCDLVSNAPNGWRVCLNIASSLLGALLVRLSFNRKLFCFLKGQYSVHGVSTFVPSDCKAKKDGNFFFSKVDSTPFWAVVMEYCSWARIHLSSTNGRFLQTLTPCKLRLVSGLSDVVWSSVGHFPSFTSAFPITLPFPLWASKTSLVDPKECYCQKIFASQDISGYLGTSFKLGKHC